MEQSRSEQKSFGREVSHMLKISIKKMNSFEIDYLAAQCEESTYVKSFFQYVNLAAGYDANIAYVRKQWILGTIKRGTYHVIAHGLRFCFGRINHLELAGV